MIEQSQSAHWLGYYLKYKIYYVKVSGIASGNKLIKTIRYLHMWRYHIVTCEDIDDFTDSKFVSLIVLRFAGVLSKHLRVFLERLRQSLEIFGHLRKFRKFSANFRECSCGLWNSFMKIFGNLPKVVGNLRKIIKNAVISMFI